MLWAHFEEKKFLSIRRRISIKTVFDTKQIDDYFSHALEIATYSITNYEWFGQKMWKFPFLINARKF